MSLQSLLSADSFTHQRSQGVTKDASGGAVRPPWKTVASGIACRVEDTGADMVLAFEQPGQIVTHMLTTQYTDLRARDRVITSDGRTMVVKGVMKVRGLGGIPTYFEASLSELRPNA